MIQISCNNIKKYYGAELILQEVSFEVNEKECVALVGPNGCGKSTMLKILCKLENYEEGTIAIRKDAVVGYLEQNPQYPEELTVRDVIQLACSDIYECKRQMNGIEEQLASDVEGMEELLKRYSDCCLRYEHLGGYELEERYSKIYQGLSLKENMLDKKFHQLSGGEKTIVCLAKTLLMNPDILILDEPTNHLDMSMLSWLEEYLASYKGCVIFVSHDRYFLKAVATKIVDMEYGKSEVYPYAYERYKEEKQKKREVLEAAYKDQQKQIQKMEEAIKRMRIWAKQANNEKMFARAESMQKRLERIDKIEKPIKINYQAQLEFGHADRSGTDVLMVENIEKAYGEKVLLKEADLCVYYKEHVALIGENGCGKSTFLKMLFGEERLDGGNIKIGSSLKVAYLPQQVTFSHEDWTVLETFREDLNLSEGNARELLAKHLFTKDKVFKKVQNLSGGERSRLKFAMLLQHEINFLILDEPTNHLDIPSRERLEEALLSFQGTILMISHDRYFINRLATRVVEFDHGKLVSYAGNYNDYVIEKEKLSHDRKESKVVSEEKIKKSSSPVEKKITKSTPIEKKRSRYTQERILEEIEDEIDELESRKRDLDTQYDNVKNDYIQLEQLNESQNVLEEKIDLLMEEWTKVSSEMEEIMIEEASHS